VLLEPIDDSVESAGAMAQLIFDVGAEFGKRCCMAEWGEKWIIAKAAVAMGRGCDFAIDRAAEVGEHFALLSDDHDADKACGAFWIGHMSHLGE
jgi:hypothetical protein